MWLIDVLAAVAEEELEKLRKEEEQERKKKKEEEEAAKPIVTPCKRRRTEHHHHHRKINSNVVATTHDNNDVHLPATESKPEKVCHLKFTLNLNKKKKQAIGNFEDKIESKTGDNNVDPVPPLPQSASKKGKKPGSDNVDPDIEFRGKPKNPKRKPEPERNNPNPAPGLPPEFREMILNRAGGRRVGSEILVIQKKLTTTDLKDHQNRFSIPVNQMKNGAFLSEKTEKFLRGRDKDGRCNVLNVGIIEPRGEVKSVNLTRWAMTKMTGKPSISYVLNGEGWKKIKASNRLQVEDVVQLWAVQIEEELCLVFVKLEN